MKKIEGREEILNLIENYKEAGDKISLREAEEIYENEVCFGEFEREEDMKDYYETSDGPKEVPEVVEAYCEEVESRIKVVMVKPLLAPQVVYIDSGLKSMQDIVGGYIEQMMPFDEEVALIMNEEGKILKMILNRAIRNRNGEIYDIITGTFFVCGASGENFSSLTDEQIQRYYDLFKNPEVFVSINGNIQAITINK